MARINIVPTLLVFSALSLAGLSAWMSINGMAVLFPAAPMAIWLGALLQAAKFMTAAWLSDRWAQIELGHRIALLVFVVMIGAINFVSTFSCLVYSEMTEVAPVMSAAELLGIQGGGEEVMRWLIAGIVMCADPFVLALAAAIASRGRRTA